jgi:hypothetical protein
VLRRYSRLFGSPGSFLRGESLGVSDSLSAACGDADSNTGVEALEAINETHLLAFCEEGPDETDLTSAPVRILRVERGGTGQGGDGAEQGGGGMGQGDDGAGPGAGWRWSASVAARFTLRLRGGLTPSDVARIPPSNASAPADFLLLERSYAPGFGNRVRVRLVRGDALARAADGGGEMNPPELFTFTPDAFATDNFEGIAVARASAGEGGLPAAGGGDASTEGFRIFLVSDDNFRPDMQRTLLYELFWSRGLNATGDRPACCSAAEPPSDGGSFRLWAVGGVGAVAAVLCLLLLLAAACRRRARGHSSGGLLRRQQRPAVQLGAFPVQACGGGPAALQLHLR